MFVHLSHPSPHFYVETLTFDVMVFGSGIFVKYVKVLEKNDMHTNVHVHVHTGLYTYTQNIYLINAYVYMSHSCGYNNQKPNSLI